MIRAVWSVAIVLVMVASAFAIVAYAKENPTIWPSEEYYVPGETVQINGKGWSPYSAVTIVMTHPDFESEKTYVVIPELYGNFACTNYTAEGVENWDQPVIVTATQNQGGTVVTATTQFYDPAVSLQGYTLKPNPGWTAGDVKGYNEGDSVPYKVKLEKKAFGSTVTVTLGFDYRDESTGYYGVDYLTRYKEEPPESPFNVYPISTHPFWVDPSEGNLTSQVQLPNQYDSGTSRFIIVWQFTLVFAGGASDATVRWGAHMAVSDEPNGYYGASYFPGSSLHVRVVDLDPPSNQGNRDVPIALGGAYPVLTPPEMTLDKWVEPLADPDPQVFKIGDTVTFTIEFSNVGQADAKCVMIDDYLPSVVAYVEGSAVLWTSEDSTHLPFAPTMHTSVWLEWGPFAWRGTGEYDSLPVLVGYIQFQAIILESAVPGIYWNEAHLTYTDDHGGFFEPLYAEAPFEIVGMPTITIEKSGPDYAHVGDTITYTYVVTNTGPTDIVDLDVWDDVAGWIVQDAYLAAGASVTYTKDYTILETDPDPLHNTVYANGEDEFGQDAPEVTASWDVDILHPAITVTKTADKTCAIVGEDIRYTIHYMNAATDDTVLYDVTITDPLLGISTNVGTLNPGEGGYIYKTIPAVEVVSDPDGEMPNTVTATGHDILDDPVKSYVTATASWVVDIKHPGILIDKWATYVGSDERLVCVGEGDVILWHIEVTNPSSDTEMFYEVYDEMLGAVDVPLFSGSLGPMESYTWVSDPWTVPIGVDDPLVNVAYVKSHDCQDHYVFDESGDWPSATVTLDVLHPGIMIDKWVTYVDSDLHLRCVGENDIIIWHIMVTNPSADTTMYYDVYDPLLSSALDDLLFSGTLAPGASFTWSSDPWTVPVGVDDPLVNMAWVEAYDAQGHPAYAEDGVSWPSATVTLDVLHPAITIDKWATYVDEMDRLACVGEGDIIIWHIMVTNPSADTTMYYDVYDPLLSSAPDDLLFSGTLVAGASFTWSSDPWTVPVGVDDPLVNVAWVIAHDAQDHYVHADTQNGWPTAIVTLDVLHPAIGIVKWVTYVDSEEHLQCVGIGDVILWHISVYNPSEDTYMNYEVWDPMLDPTPGDPLFSGRLAPLTGYDWVSTPWTVPIGVSDPLYNLAYVIAWDDQYHYVYDVNGYEGLWPYADVTLDVLHPGMLIEKWATYVGSDEPLACVGEGDIIIWHIMVTNPSADTTMYFDVYDPMLGSPPDGWLFGGTLAPLASMIWTSDPWTVPQGVEDPLVNTAWVEAYDAQGHPAYVEDSTDWPSSTVTLDVLHPAITIDKWATYVDEMDRLACVGEGDIIIWHIMVTNPSADTTMYFDVYDPMLGSPPDGWLFGGTLAPLASMIWTSDPWTVPVGVDDPLVNVAWVIAHDAQDHYVHADTQNGWPTAIVTLDVLHPAITIVKWATYVGSDERLECVGEGDIIIWHITVTNPSPDTYMNYVVYDPRLTVLPDDPLFFNRLAPGEVINWVSDPWTVPVGVEDPLINTAYVVAWDDQLHYVYDEQTGEWPSSTVELDVLHPMITIDKWATYPGSEERLVCVGENDVIIWHIMVTNPSPDTTMYFDVYDPMLSAEMDGWLFADELEPGWADIWSSAAWTVPVGVQNPLVNTAWVVAHDKQDHYVFDLETDTGWPTAIVTLEVLHPQILVEKVGPEWADVGSTITYTVTVTNIGDTKLFNVDVTDSLVGPIGHFAELDVLESQTIIYTYVVPPGPDPVYNFVEAWGWDKQDHYVYDNADWTVQKYSRVDGYKLIDLGNFGVAGVYDWTVRLVGDLFSGGAYDETRQTDSNGYFEFLHLEAGIYTLSEVMQNGWIPLGPTSYSFTLDYGATVSDNFVNMPTGSISGAKWHDANLNGEWDVGEEGVADWTIYLDGIDVTGAEVHMSTTTGPDGTYTFSGLYPGLYTVSEEDVAGWFPTTLTHVPVDVSALETFEITDINFGNAKYGQIIGCKWIDEFMNGVWDGGEVAVPGWTIWLEGDTLDGEHVGPISTVTGENGWYAFTGLKPGTYTVWEELPEGWVAPVTPTSHTFTLVEGSIADCGKFGNVQYGSIPVSKFLDWDMDGDWDPAPTEPGIPGWKITLTGVLNDQDGTVVGPIVKYTDENGEALFDHLLPGIYTITEELPAGWYNTNYDHKVVIITSGWNVPLHNIKFGNVPYTCVWGYKFDDTNGNGVRDEGEPGVPGWTVTITGVRADGVQIEPIVLTTDENGMWQSCYNLLPGRYTVTEDSVEGWMPTTATSYSFTVPINRECLEPSAYHIFDFGNFKLGKIWGYKYEDANGNGVLDNGDHPIEGWTIIVTPPWGVPITVTTDADGYWELTGLPAGDYFVEEAVPAGWVPTNDACEWVTIVSHSNIQVHTFLNTYPGMIWGYKFEDLNGNGVWDDGEHPIAEWTIYLLQGDLVVDTTMTDGNGYYQFLNVWPGDYTVAEDLPPDWVPTTVPYEDLSIESSGVVRVHDFGNWQPVWITLFKFEDMYHNGIFDNDDSGLVWEFTLTSPSGIVYTVTTDGTGVATFLLNEPGVWTITEASVGGWCPTTPSTVEVYVESGHAYNLATQEEQYRFFFGNFHCVTITIFKYEDVDSNGMYDEAVDMPLEGWEIVLYDYISDATVTLYTDENGLATYTFCDYGDWSIVEVLPPHWRQVTPDSEGYEIIVISGHVINVCTQEEQYYFEFGNFQCVEIQVFKYWDKCSSGWYEPEINGKPFDEPIEGWYFELVDVTGMVLQYGWTDENGELSFWVCHAGTYYVIEEDREGWSHINPADGFLQFDILSGDGPIAAWFGNYQIVHVPIFKYEDVNSNGIYDDGDHPLEGWHFDLVRVGDGLTYSGETDADGNLVLNVDRSGIYVLTEEDRAGWVHVNPADGMTSFEIYSGIVIPVQMFGNFRIVQIPVFKFDDIYANGEYDPMDGDVPIEGWTFELWEWNPDTLAYDILVDTQVTDATGHAMFTVDHAGSFLVKEEAREGWFWIYPLTGEYYVTVVSGMATSDPPMMECELQFANFKMGKIYGYKWNDLNGNGVWDDGEPPLEGWTIHFRTSMGFFMEGSVETDANGYYEFTGLPPALYNVWEDVQDGWVATSPDHVDEVMIIGHAQVRIDFLNFEKGCVVGHKYVDLYGNGVYDPEDDVGLAGWWVYLWWVSYVETPEGPISATGLYAQVQTDENGYYAFCDLPPGTYWVSEESRTCWIATSPTSSGQFLLHSGETVTFDFLNFQKGRICGYKFEDSNSNGIWDEGEHALSSWPIHLIEDDLETVYTTYTNENGWFCFKGLGPDYYMVYEDPRDTPGWTPTTTIAYTETMTSGACIVLDPFGNFHNVGITVFKYEDMNTNGLYGAGDVPLGDWYFEVLDDGGSVVGSGTTDSNGEISFTFTQAGHYTIVEYPVVGWEHSTPDVVDIDVTSGQCYNMATQLEQYYFMFGNYRPGTITGEKFYDWNMDGLFNGEDYGITNWVIVLHGDLYNGDTVDITRLTASDGSFRFDGLLAGVYTVSEVVPLGWHATSPISATVTVHSGDAQSVVFSNVHWGKIWGYKFYDKNLDGLMDEDEPGLEGWTIVLEGTRDDGTPVYETCITDVNGYYEFPEVQPGIYTINEIVWPTWQATTSLPIDVSVSGDLENWELQFNIGNIQFAKIWGYKFLDTYAKTYPFWPNGVFDEDEYGLGNWEITLDGDTTGGAHVHMVTYTDNIDVIGYYEFDNLLPGTYTISETLLHGYWATTQLSKTVIVYPFPIGPVIIRIDFGNLVPSKDPEVNFVLQAGWNMWSTPVDVAGLTAKSLLDAIGPNGLLIMRIDKVGNCLDTYMVDDDKLGLPDFPIVVGEGYYVYTLGDTSFKLMGYLPGERTEPLTSGWNFIGHDGLKPISASQFLAKIQGGTGFVIMGYNPNTGNLDTYVMGDDSTFDFEVTPGRAYFVYVIGDASITY